MYGSASPICELSSPRLSASPYPRLSRSFLPKHLSRLVCSITAHVCRLPQLIVLGVRPAPRSAATIALPISPGTSPM